MLSKEYLDKWESLNKTEYLEDYETTAVIQTLIDEVRSLQKEKEEQEKCIDKIIALLDPLKTVH